MKSFKEARSHERRSSERDSDSDKSNMAVRHSDSDSDSDSSNTAVRGRYSSERALVSNTPTEPARISTLTGCSLVDAQKIIGFVRDVRERDGDKRRNGIQGLRKLANHKETEGRNGDAIREAGGIAPLVKSLDVGGVGLNSETMSNLTRLIESLSINHINRDVIREAGGIPHLLNCMGAHVDNTRKNASIAILNLSINETNKVSIREAGGIPILVNRLSDDIDRVRYGAAGALNSLAKNEMNRDVIRQKQGIAPLVGLLRDGDVGIRNIAIVALSNLSKNKENQAEIINVGAQSILLRLLNDSDSNIASKAQLTLDRCLPYIQRLEAEANARAAAEATARKQVEAKARREVEARAKARAEAEAKAKIEAEIHTEAGQLQAVGEQIIQDDYRKFMRLVLEIKYPDVCLPDSPHGTLLHLAIYHARPEMVMELLKRSVSTEIKNKEGQTASVLAQRTNQPLMLFLLGEPTNLSLALEAINARIETATMVSSLRVTRAHMYHTLSLSEPLLPQKSMYLKQARLDIARVQSREPTEELGLFDQVLLKLFDDNQAAIEAEKTSESHNVRHSLRAAWATADAQTTLSAYINLIKGAPREGSYYRELGDFYVYLAEKSTRKLQKKTLYSKALPNYEKAVDLNPLDEDAAQRHEDVSGLIEASETKASAQALPSQGIFKQAPSSEPTTQFTPAQRAAIDARKAEKK